MDVQHQCVLEVQEQVLSMGGRVHHGVSVQQCGAGGKAALGTADSQPLAGEHVSELAGQPVYGVAFRHYSTISPVVS
jgi:hypothetical protein